jgi:glutathione S-transferase
MTIQVYSDPCTINSHKVLAGLEEMKADYNQNFINYFEGEHKSESYMKINPHATVPSATDGDLTLTESNSILQYAADKTGAETLYPKDLKHRADVNRWLLWEAATWFSVCYVYVIENVVKPLMKAEPDQKAIDEQSEKFHRGAGIMNTALGKNKWLTGPNVTIADIAVAAPMHLHAASKLPLDKYPNVKRWLTQIESLESWKKTQTAVDKALLPNASANDTTTNGSNGANDAANHPSSVRATVNYTHPVPTLTELYFYETPKSTLIHPPGDHTVSVTIHNARPHASTLSLDKNGFALSPFHTSFSDWENESAVRSTFYLEIVSFLQKTQAASRVLVFDHTIRTEKNASKALTDEKNTSQRSPVMLVHCDYTSESGPLRMRQMLPDEAEDLLSRRVAFINVWKPINRVVEERPLAMIDTQSCRSKDFFKLHLRYRDRDGENYVMRYREGHKWWYFPSMTTEEVVLLKTFESEGGRAGFVGHSAFVDPTSREGAPLRESVEIRAVCFF